MPEVEYVGPDGSTRAVTAEAATSIMRVAVQNSVPGIVGECGGQAMCGTCHVYVDEAFVDALPPVGDDEQDMLDLQVRDPDPGRSRLSCQIVAGAAGDRIRVFVPASQY